MVSSPVDETGSDREPTGLVELGREHGARFLKFGLVGGLGVVVNWIFFEVGYALTRSVGEGVAYTAGILLGLFVSIFTNFILNDIWTWADREKGGWWHWLYRMGKYYVSALAAGAIQVGVAWFTRVFVWSYFDLRIGRTTLSLLSVDVTIPAADLGPRLGLFSGIACGMVVNFLAGHLWAFRDADNK